MNNVRQNSGSVLCFLAILALPTPGSAHGESVLPYGKSRSTPSVFYDNDQTRDVYTDELLMAMASAGKIKLVGMSTSRTINGIGYDKYDELAEERRRMVRLARQSGMRHLPEPVLGPKVSLARPASGRIGDTAPIDTPASRAIIAAARQCAAAEPLVVLTGGQLTAVADAYLLEPSIADKMVVASLLGTRSDMDDFNGKQDPWACYIVLARLVYVQFPFRQAPPRVPKEFLATELPDMPLRQWMLDKVHPLFPKVYPGGEDHDAQPVLPLLTDTYVAAVKRVKFGGWKKAPFGDGHVEVPSFADAEERDPSRAWVVMQARQAEGTTAWQAAMADPVAWGLSPAKNSPGSD
jgi:hypothetical protein